MTLLEYAQLVLPATRIRDIDESASVAEVQELCLVLSQAVSEYFALVPAIHRRTTVTYSLGGVEQVEIELVKGEYFTVGEHCLSSWRGRSIEILLGGGESRWDEIVATDRLLGTWVGESGVYQARVHPDCVAIADMLIQRICTHPQVVTEEGNHIDLLPLHENCTLPYYVSAMDVTTSARVSRSRDFAQYPTRYSIEYVGRTIASIYDAGFQFRVFPIPMLPWRVRFDAEISALAIRIGDLVSSKTLPIPDDAAMRILLPIARGKAMESPLIANLAKSSKPAEIDRAAERARLDARMMPSVFGASHSHIGTPPGW